MEVIPQNNNGTPFHQFLLLQIYVIQLIMEANQIVFLHPQKV